MANKVSDSSKKPKKLKKEDLEQQIGELTADLQRVQADFINYKRRSEEDLQRRHGAAQRALMAGLLPTIDNIERALVNVPKELKDNGWAQGVSKTAHSMFESLKQHGVSKIPTVGEEFDPELMEAVSVEGEGDNEIVSEELQAGYVMGEDILRHAMVKVKRSK